MTTYSGAITVTTAGTAVQGTAGLGAGKFYIRAYPANAGNVFVGNDGAGDVTDDNGYVLEPGDAVTFVGELASLWFDAASDGDTLRWLRYATYGEVS